MVNNYVSVDENGPIMTTFPREYSNWDIMSCEQLYSRIVAHDVTLPDATRRDATVYGDRSARRAIGVADGDERIALTRKSRGRGKWLVI